MIDVLIISILIILLYRALRRQYIKGWFKYHYKLSSCEYKEIEKYNVDNYIRLGLSKWRAKYYFFKNIWEGRFIG